MLAEAGKPVASAICKLKAVAADAYTARQLDVAPATPVLLLHQTHFTAEHQAILYCENYHNTELIEFQVLRWQGFVRNNVPCNAATIALIAVSAAIYIVGRPIQIQFIPGMAC